MLTSRKTFNLGIKDRRTASGRKLRSEKAALGHGLLEDGSLQLLRDNILWRWTPFASAKFGYVGSTVMLFALK
jgi:hypothetical protein